MFSILLILCQHGRKLNPVQNHILPECFILKYVFIGHTFSHNLLIDKGYRKAHSSPDKYSCGMYTMNKAQLSIPINIV